jgi:hypothetical protein
MSEFVPLFTEGFDTRDLKEAEALLEELRVSQSMVLATETSHDARPCKPQLRRSGAFMTQTTSSNNTEIDRWGAFGRGVQWARRLS